MTLRSRDIRDWTQPPNDALAECMCLYGCLVDPKRIGLVDLEPLLTYPDHRRIWQTMVATHKRKPEVFWSAWLDDIKGEANWFEFLDLVVCPERESARAWRSYSNTSEHDGRLSIHYHGFEWWLGRLRQIQAARKRIDELQAEVSRLWRVPDEPALVTNPGFNLQGV